MWRLQTHKQICERRAVFCFGRIRNLTSWEICQAERWQAEREVTPDEASFWESHLARHLHQPSSFFLISTGSSFLNFLRLDKDFPQLFTNCQIFILLGLFNFFCNNLQMLLHVWIFTTSAEFSSRSDQKWLIFSSPPVTFTEPCLAKTTCNRTPSGKTSLRRQTPAGFPPELKKCEKDMKTMEKRYCWWPKVWLVKASTVQKGREVMLDAIGQ